MDMRRGGPLLLGLLAVAIAVTSSAEATPSTREGSSGKAIGLAAGGRHTCVIASTHGVVCWGSASYGEVGPACDYGHCRPVTVPGLENITALDAGDEHSCALTAAGSVACWGSNRFGELGPGCPREACAQPVEVPGLGPATAISTG